MNYGRCEQICESLKSHGLTVVAHPKARCDANKTSPYYAVAGASTGDAQTAAVDVVRDILVNAGLGYCIEISPAWDKQVTFAIY